MSYFFLRFIPYLYYFVRGQYQRDLEAPVGDGKKRFKYRTVIAVLISILILVSIFGVVKIHQQSVVIVSMNNATHATQGSVNVLTENQEKMDKDLISRDVYERDIHDLVYRNAQLIFDANSLANELERICTKSPMVCTDDARETIASHKELRNDPGD